MSPFRAFLTAIIVMLAIFFALKSARADEGLYITGDIGQARFSKTTPDGTWWQQGLGYHMTKQSFAWGAGLGYGWEHWAVEATYLDFGHVSIGGKAVGDDAYHPETHTYDPGAKQVTFDTFDRLQGGSIRVKYNLDVYGVRPFLAAGIWAGHHSLSFWTNDGCGHVSNNNIYGGVLAGPVVGGGICYQWVCGQVDYYRAVTQGGFPVSTEVIMPSAVLKVPLSW